MDDLFSAAIFVVGTLLACAGVIYGINDLADIKETQVVEACKNDGFWNHGQTRIICSIEGKKSED